MFRGKWTVWHIPLSKYLQLFCFSIFVSKWSCSTCQCSHSVFERLIQPDAHLYICTFVVVIKPSQNDVLSTAFVD